MRNKLIYNAILILVSVLFFNSCKITKRKYLSGFLITNQHTFAKRSFSDKNISINVKQQINSFNLPHKLKNKVVNKEFLIKDHPLKKGAITLNTSIRNTTPSNKLAIGINKFYTDTTQSESQKQAINYNIYEKKSKKLFIATIVTLIVSSFLGAFFLVFLPANIILLIKLNNNLKTMRTDKIYSDLIKRYVALMVINWLFPSFAITFLVAIIITALYFSLSSWALMLALIYIGVLGGILLWLIISGAIIIRNYKIYKMLNR